MIKSKKISKLRRLWLSTWAMIIGQVRINHTTVIHIENRIFIIKRRYWLGEIIVILSNIFLRWCQIKVQFLRKKEWMRREKEVNRLLYSKECMAHDKAGIYFPLINGPSLADVLESENDVWEHKRTAYARAVSALKELHALTLTYHAEKSILSHGDASIYNVILDLETQKAVWIDFETIHLSGTKPLWCQMDDLQVLLFSASKYVFKERRLHDLLSLSVTAYSIDSFWDIFIQAMENTKTFSLAFFLARTRLTFAEYQQSRAMIEKIIPFIFEDKHVHVAKA